MKDLFNSEQLEALRHHFPNISKAMEEGKTYSSKSLEAEVSAWVCNPPPPRGATKRQLLSMECYAVRIRKTFLQGSENGCVLIRKKVYGVGARQDGWSAPCRWALPDR